MGKSEQWRKAQAEGAKMREARTNYAKVEAALKWDKEIPGVLDDEVPVQRAAKAIIELGVAGGTSIATIMRTITLARKITDDNELMLNHMFIGQEVEYRRLLRTLQGFTPSPYATGQLLELNRKLRNAVALIPADG